MGRTGSIPDVNAHLHTPWSFSAFESIPRALDAASAEDVRVVGINDFYSTDGYEEWARECSRRRLFPIFGIEMIGLDEAAQAGGMRVNDPANPGRTYLSGKGLKSTGEIPEPRRSRLAAVRAGQNAQVRAMCAKLNDYLAVTGAGFTLDADEIERTLTQGNLRERHLAKAMRMKLPSTDDPAKTENEIRAKLLKAGGAAFVAETPGAFLPVGEIVEIIRAAGGIPTYPFLGDDAKGGYTDFERDIDAAAKNLKARNIYSVEFITTRNNAPELEHYATWLWDNGFVVTFGSEHNTPVMEPVLLTTRGGEPLSDKLKEINYAGACIVAAHQDMVATGGRGYLDAEGRADAENREKYIAHGDKVIKSVIYG